MTKLERVELLSSKRDFLYLFTLFLLLFTLSLSYQYYNYRQLTKFDSALLRATVIKQYKKTKTDTKDKTKSYQVLKLKTENDLSFYTVASKRAPDYRNKQLLIEIQTANINFLSYLKGFFTFSKIIEAHRDRRLKTKISHALISQHKEKAINAIYQALFLAKPLPYSLQQHFSNLGITHLLAISGFHLGVLSTMLFFLFRYPYRFLQNRYFPYRSAKRDLFFLVAATLFAYTLFLEYPPSLLRAFAMLIIGFVLYDRGIKIISMQTLFISTLLILALFPKLIFSIGFFLSISGVFYIFLFLLYFKSRHRVWQFFLLPFWVYLMMLPYALVIFGNFSLYHPLSILFSSLFSLFYPLSILLHLIGMGNLLDPVIHFLLDIKVHPVVIELNNYYLYISILLSLMAVLKKEALYLLLLYSFSIFIYAMYHVA